MKSNEDKGSENEKEDDMKIFSPEYREWELNGHVKQKAMDRFKRKAYGGKL